LTIDRLISEVDNRIANLIPPNEITSRFYGMLRYHLGWVDEQLQPAHADAGKRIRARLCLLACQAVGGDPSRALAAATSVELIHNFSLIHDDIQDRSEYRRHRRTVWAIWGEAQAINAGDDTFVLAQLALVNNDLGDPNITVRAIQVLNDACRFLCEGQFLDLAFERLAVVEVSEYYAMIERKTAALLEAACHLGAIFGGAGSASTAALSGFGRQLGIAFQVRDDYLGIWGDSRETGKPAADDVSSKKKTLPLLYALQTAAPPNRAIVEEIMSRPGVASEADVDRVLAILDQCGAADFTASEAERHSDLAMEILSRERPQNPAHAELGAICRKLAGRSR
jgi:geranylgeranyl diphosphate synthase type I